MNNGGRPKKEIDLKMFETMCGIQCTKEEICNILDINEKTLTRWCNDTYGIGFYDIYKKKSATGKMSLRRMQFKLAEKNATMAIFLGKNYLGQKDNVEITDNREINEQIQNIAKLINKPQKVRTEKDIEEENE